MNDSEITWPGGLRQKPEGVIIPTFLKVVTIVEQPFIYARRIGEGELCNADEGEVACPWFNNTIDTMDRFYCCRGYCIDLLKELAKRNNFTYALALSPDGQFGTFGPKNGTGKKEWNGLIGELVNDRADMIVAPLTINPERAQVIEFSKPFKYQGITILEKKVSLDLITWFSQPSEGLFYSNPNRLLLFHFSNRSAIHCGYWLWYLSTSLLLFCISWTGSRRSVTQLRQRTLSPTNEANAIEKVDSVWRMRKTRKKMHSTCRLPFGSLGVSS